MRTREHSLAISRSLKGHSVSPETRRKIGNANRGRKLSPKDKERVTKQLRELAKGKIGVARPQSVRDKIRKSKKGIATVGAGEIHPLWRGDEVGYSGIHIWLKDNYGKASQCQNINCKSVSKNYDWAKLRGVEYKRNRSNFIQLCKSCHRKYDVNETYEIDIRDLLVEANRVDITSNGMGDGRGGDGIGKAPYVAGRTLCGKIYPSGQERCNSGACNVCYPTN